MNIYRNKKYVALSIVQFTVFEIQQKKLSGMKRSRKMNEEKNQSKLPSKLYKWKLEAKGIGKAVTIIFHMFKKQGKRLTCSVKQGKYKKEI